MVMTGNSVEFCSSCCIKHNITQTLSHQFRGCILRKTWFIKVWPTKSAKPKLVIVKKGGLVHGEFPVYVSSSSFLTLVSSSAAPVAEELRQLQLTIVVSSSKSCVLVGVVEVLILKAALKAGVVVVVALIVFGCP